MDELVQVKRLWPGIVAQIDQLGFLLTERVRVQLVGPDELASQTSRHATAHGSSLLGVTRIAVGPDQRRAVEVSVLRGLPTLWFGQTVVHENMHAWLAEQGVRAATAPVEEGLCELAAYGWLKLQAGDRVADGLRQNLVQNPHPVYGDGLRSVQAAVRMHGLQPVIASVRTTGALPV